MRPHRVVVLDVLTKHPPEMLFVGRDDMVETLAPERADDALGDGVGIRRVHPESESSRSRAVERVR